LFDASKSFDPEGLPLLYAWDLENDGIPEGSSYYPKITHSFPTELHRTVKVFVTDAAGACRSDSADVYVWGNTSPIAEAGGPYKSIVGWPVSVDARGSRDFEGGPLQYEWSFGGYGNFGASSPDSVASYTFNSAGNKVINVRVTDMYGATSTDYATVTVVSSGVLLVSPNGGENLRTGDQIPISWQADPGIAQVKIRYSLNGKKTWSDAAVRMSALPAQFMWTIPGGSSTKAYVKVVGYKANGAKVSSDISDRPFTIEP